jgi:hypothetical protein
MENTMNLDTMTTLVYRVLSASYEVGMLDEDVSREIAKAIISAQGDEKAYFRVGKNAPETSKAMSMKVRQGTLQDDVLTLFVNLYRAGGVGATDDDIEVSLKRSHQSVSGARNTLVRKGYLVDSGFTRLNRYGNQAIRWEYTGKVVER